MESEKLREMKRNSNDSGLFEDTRSQPVACTTERRVNFSRLRAWLIVMATTTVVMMAMIIKMMMMMMIRMKMKKRKMK